MTTEQAIYDRFEQLIMSRRQRLNELAWRSGRLKRIYDQEGHCRPGQNTRLRAAVMIGDASEEAEEIQLLLEAFARCAKVLTTRCVSVRSIEHAEAVFADMAACTQYLFERGHKDLADILLAVFVNNEHIQGLFAADRERYVRTVARAFGIDWPHGS